MVIKKDLIREIKRQNKAIKKGEQNNFNFLGFVEKDFVEEKIKVFFSCGVGCFDWINGNDNLKTLIKEVLK